MAVHGVPLYAIVQNLGQTNSGYRSVGGTNKVLSQGFTTGSHADVYVLQGIGVNIEGSGGNVPDGSASVSVAVHADSGGQPGAKLFDLLSPTEYAAGHSFFEAPRGTELSPNTSYVMAWSHLDGTVHRIRKTGSNSEDSGALTDFSIANAFYQGPNLDSMAANSSGDALEIAVYTRIQPPNATGRAGGAGFRGGLLWSSVARGTRSIRVPTSTAWPRTQAAMRWKSRCTPESSPPMPPAGRWCWLPRSGCLLVASLKPAPSKSHLCTVD